MTRLLVGSLIERTGLQMVAVGCAEEALLRFCREHFDCVMIDVAMDGTAGLATARAIRDRCAPVLPIIALGTGELNRVLQHAGFSAVLETPRDGTQIANALYAAMSPARAGATLH
ncbi:response regulator [Lutibaculum baratangense]|uniref:Response regulatory domain-containing protein n=1 Tax=Lutibaculum baratangense AMV1 TaxID=631454 RepID=V4QWN0_9HYPH|nr:response regulator [Lutibaculum baratangense]ESR24162.1 hypothetical protein N177_2611 [Lutibaculum baratangense AMV1]